MNAKPLTNIKNVVFDLGNVMVRWAPQEIVRLALPECHDSDEMARQLFQSDIWQDINKGLLSERAAKTRFQAQFTLSAQTTDALFYYVRQTQIPIYGAMDLLTRIKAAGYGAYALTDNVHEIVAHLKSTYDFWQLFDGAVVSAEVGLLKPQPEIYHTLLTENHLVAEETIFLDDMLANVKGAQAVGMHAIQFTTAQQAECILQEQFDMNF